MAGAEKVSSPRAEEIFGMMDSQGTGTINLADFKKVFPKLMQQLSPTNNNKNNKNTFNDVLPSRNDTLYPTQFDASAEKIFNYAFRDSENDNTYPLFWPGQEVSFDEEERQELLRLLAPAVAPGHNREKSREKSRTTSRHVNSNATAAATSSLIPRHGNNRAASALVTPMSSRISRPGSNTVTPTSSRISRVTRGNGIAAASSVTPKASRMSRVGSSASSVTPSRVTRGNGIAAAASALATPTSRTSRVSHSNSSESALVTPSRVNHSEASAAALVAPKSPAAAAVAAVADIGAREIFSQSFGVHKRDEWLIAGPPDDYPHWAAVSPADLIKYRTPSPRRRNSPGRKSRRHRRRLSVKLTEDGDNDIFGVTTMRRPRTPSEMHTLMQEHKAADQKRRELIDIIRTQVSPQSKDKELDEF